MEEKKFILFLVLSALIFLGWSLAYEKLYPSQTANKQKAVPGATTPSSSPTAAPAQAAQAQTPEQTQTQPAAPQVSTELREIKLKTDLWNATLSNQGGVLTEWTMTKFTDGKAIDPAKGGVNLISGKISQDLGGYFRFHIPGDKALEDELNAARYVVESGPEQEIFINKGERKEIVFAYNNNGVSARKKLVFKGAGAENSSGYDFNFQAEVTRNGQPVEAYLVVGPNFGDHTVTEVTVYQHAPQLTYAVGSSVSRMQGTEFEGATAKPVPAPAVSWAAVDDNYFAMALVPPAPVPAVGLNVHRKEQVKGEEIERNYVSVALKLAQGQVYNVYAGPKDFTTLQAVSDNFKISDAAATLEDIISYGWLDFIRGLVKPIARFMLAALRWINQFTHNYGWSIVALTVILNLFFFPLRWYSSLSMKRAAALQPKMKELQDKMKNLKKDDPRILELQKEQLALMKDGNPLMGCLPMLLQMPFLMAVFAVLSVSIEVRHAPFIGWLTDLSAPDPHSVLPIIMVVTMIAQQALTPTVGDPVQKRMMYIMPVMFGFFFVNAPAGLVLYWLVGTVMGVVQQYVINKLSPPTTPPATNQSQTGKQDQQKPKGKKTKEALANP